ncbi:MAG TPA: peptidylprolyl isomerase [Chloroflexi bacterium]|nr:peptidylprolyl isomerase [Chloroflexota bacterium]
MTTPEKIEKDTVVTLQYALKLEDGTLVEESSPDNPLVYLHGHGNLIPGLERQLEGLTVGAQKTFVVEPADAYGEYDPEDVDRVNRTDLPPGLEVEVGKMLSVRDESGNQYIARISAVDEKTITLDFNHPMAGKRLVFDITVTGLRAATEEELAHGHAHEPGGHHH